MTGRLDGQTVRRVATGPGTVEPSSRPTPSWCLIIDRDGRSGAENMAVDLALLRAAQAGEVFLRFYRWSPPCLSLGRNEPALSRYDRHLIETLGLDVVRRPTGGRAVWHNAEVTYAGAQLTFVGLDQANIRIPSSLAGRGDVNVLLTADGKSSNSVVINVK